MKEYMLKKDFEVQIFVNGRPVKEYRKDGNTYIEARVGSVYSIKIKNYSSRRIVAIPTVDGLSVIDGLRGSVNSAGYIVNGRDSMIIDGWRKDEGNVATFYFSDASQAYSTSSPAGENVGVIGVAIFYEQEEFPTFKNFFSDIVFTSFPYNNVLSSYESVNCNNAWDVSCKAETLSRGVTSNGTYQQRLGTGWGETKKSEISEIPFTREKDSLTDFIFYYNTKEELSKIGIDFRDEVCVSLPTAFPGDGQRKSRFCQEPKNIKDSIG